MSCASALRGRPSSASTHFPECRQRNQGVATECHPYNYGVGTPYLPGIAYNKFGSGAIWGLFFPRLTPAQQLSNINAMF